MTFDRLTKLATTLGAILLGLWAAFTYYDTANRDLRKPFNDLQLTLLQGSFRRCRNACFGAANS